MTLKQDIEFLINKSAEIEKLVFRQNDNKLETVNLFYQNILVRTNRILNSVYDLSFDLAKNKYAIHILLRPLILDYYYVYFIVNKYWDNEKGVLDKNSVENLAYLCLTDGVESYYKSIKKNLSYLSKEEKKDIEANFKKIFAFCIKDINVNFNNIEFDIDKNNDESIVASKIEKQLKNGNNNGDELKNLYDFFSKYDHNTIVGLIDYIIMSKDTILIEESIFMIRKNFVFLLLLVWSENKLSEVLELYNSELKNISCSSFSDNSYEDT
jgi:hypothetical protein